MSVPFARTPKQLNSRYLSLAHKLNDELGFREQFLRFRAHEDRTGATLWRLENDSQFDRLGLIGGMSARLAEAADSGSELQFGLSEHWVRDRTSLRFKSSNLRFAILSTDPGASPLHFRLEWAGRQDAGRGKYEFTGKGAAHPHWQFDSELTSPIGDPTVLAVEQVEDAVIDITLSEEGTVVPVDLDDNAASSVTSEASQPSAIPGALPWFHRLHLPAKALWSDSLCEMPNDAEAQQHQPTNVEELESWVISALRYMRHEFALYSA